MCTLRIAKLDQPRVMLVPDQEPCVVKAIVVADERCNCQRELLLIEDQANLPVNCHDCLALGDTLLCVAPVRLDQTRGQGGQAEKLAHRYLGDVVGTDKLVATTKVCWSWIAACGTVGKIDDLCGQIVDIGFNGCGHPAVSD